MMNNPGVRNIGDASIATPVTGMIITDGISGSGVPIEFVDDLEGMTGVTLSLRFLYGQGGASVKAWVQTSLDQGATWLDIACAVFATATKTAVFNLSAVTPQTNVVTPTDATLADNSAQDGVLGDRLRVKVTSTGTYSNTSLSCRAIVR